MSVSINSADGLTASGKWRDVIKKKTTQEWIPVSERLPNENVEVLVTVKVGEKTYIESGMMSSVIHGKWETIYDLYERDVYGRDRNATIIAWMPLPEPYEGGDE